MARTADAPPRHWTDALPPWALALAQLSRWDRPIGWRLLTLPCLMGLALARTEEGFWPADLQLAGLFLIGAIAMRGAGCTYNDILDREIDAAVARTRSRPLPSGRVGLRTAWAWTMAQCGVGLLVLLQLPALAQIAAVGAVPLVAAYPFMKRITWWPQAWLGLAFSWGALVAGAAVDGALRAETWLLYAGCIAWVIAYDTIYALQDVEDDALIGVRSTARLFGARWRGWTQGFLAAALALWTAAAWTAGARSLWIALAFACLAFLMARDLDRITPEDGPSALAGFHRHGLFGLAAAAIFALEPAWRTLAPLLDAGP